VNRAAWSGCAVDKSSRVLEGSLVEDELISVQRNQVATLRARGG
jgi:hypothetical protein